MKMSLLMKFLKSLQDMEIRKKASLNQMKDIRMLINQELLRMNVDPLILIYFQTRIRRISTHHRMSRLIY